MPKNRMKLSLSAVACAAVLAAVPHAASAQAAPDETLVSLFVETCTRDGVSAESIIAAIAEQPEWSEVTDVTVDVPALRMVPNRSVAAASFRQPESVRQWQRNWNGRMVSTVVATFPQGSAHRTVCALVVPDVRNAGPYITPMRDGLQAMGLVPRHTDLPHYQEYAGRLSDMRRARVEIFSRSGAIRGGLNTMHIYVGVD
jgi:hypothetical protein